MLPEGASGLTEPDAEVAEKRERWVRLVALIVAFVAVAAILAIFAYANQITPRSVAAVAPQRVQSGVTAGMIVGNVGKYLGVRVRLKCRIVDVIGDDEANADCGPTMADVLAKYEREVGNGGDFAKALAREQVDLEAVKRDEGELVLHGGAMGAMDAGDRVTVTGVVDQTQGKDKAGVETWFPTLMVDGVKVGS